jgi:hypothetical protein
MLCVQRPKPYNHYEPQQDTNNPISIPVKPSSSILNLENPMQLLFYT